MKWQWLAFAIGIAVMAAPDLFGLSDGVADAFHVLGPFAVSIAGMAAFAVLRPVRWAHLPVGAGIAITPFLFGGGITAIVIGLVAGTALAALAFPGEADHRQYAGGWRALWEPQTDTERDAG